MTPAAVLAPDRQWQLRARCASGYDGYFFPTSDRERPDERASREAVAAEVCRDCPVVQPCLDLAQELGEPEGVWGGFNERKRRAQARRRSFDAARRA